MPQACDEDQEKIRKWFGSLDTHGPQSFLESHGFILERDWTWTKPVPSHNMSMDERICLFFLIDEWDYGGTISS